MGLIDADELLRYIESKGRLSGVAEIVKNDIIRNIYKMMQSQSAQAQPKPNKLDEITRDEGLRCMLIGLINRMERIEKQVYDEIPERLKELRGERD